MAIDNTQGQQGQQGGTGTEGAAGAAAAGAAAVTPGTQGQQTQGQQGDNGQARPGATSGETAFTYKEDRSTWVDPKTGWIPKHRFDQVSTQAERARELDTQLAEANRKVAALSGIKPTDPDSVKAEGVKEAFFNLPGMGVFRKLASLTEQQLDALLQVPGQVERTTDAELRQWQRHGNSQVSYIGEKVAEALNVEAPDAEQLDDLRTVFSKWLKTKAGAEIEATGKSDTISRYEDGDQKLLDEFVASYTKRWVEPARRTAAAQNFNRIRPVPSSTGRTQVTSVQRPAAFKTLDERIEYAANLAKERGVQFGR
jgi:hypothetical protein